MRKQYSSRHSDLEFTVEHRINLVYLLDKSRFGSVFFIFDVFALTYKVFTDLICFPDIFFAKNCLYEMKARPSEWIA